MNFDRFAIPPVPTRIVGRGKDFLEVYWQDSHESRFEALQLRKICPCAVCVDEREKRQKGIPLVLDQAPPEVAKLTIKEIQMVGNYAIQITWNDGHDTGIYSFRYLRDHCPCEQHGNDPQIDGSAPASG